MELVEAIPSASKHYFKLEVLVEKALQEELIIFEVFN
jgi:hypothetical protein